VEATHYPELASRSLRPFTARMLRFHKCDVSDYLSVFGSANRPQNLAGECLP
jgi:hypothetical protein